MKGLIKRLLREDFGYRAGNLVDKAELLKNTKGSRGTGHFGTGFYFFGDENVAKEYAKGSNREGKDRVLSTIDLSKYNLLRVTDDELGYKLHDELKKWDGFNVKEIKPMIMQEIKNNIIFNLENGYDRFDDLENTIYNYLEKISDNAIDVDDVKSVIVSYLKGNDYYYSIQDYVNDDNVDKVISDINITIQKYVESVMKNKGEIYKKSLYEDLYKKLEKLGIIINKIDSNLGGDIQDRLVKGLVRSLRRDPYLEVHGGKTTLGTELIKSLGYQGIDVRGTRLDNSMFGSVIYDI
jgi:hypothetical protein